MRREIHAALGFVVAITSGAFAFAEDDIRKSVVKIEVVEVGPDHFGKRPRNC